MTAHPAMTRRELRAQQPPGRARAHHRAGGSGAHRGEVAPDLHDGARVDDSRVDDDAASRTEALAGRPVAPAPGPTRMADLEGYRGLAAVGVLVFHCYQFCRGGPTFRYAYEGTALGAVFMALDSLVDLFLVLSAYLLYSPIVGRLVDGRPQETPRSFVLKRAARILPLYWTAILVVWSARNTTFPGHWVDLVEHLTFTQVYDSRHIFWTIGPAWSLAVEVHFYALLVAVLVVLSRSGLTRAPLRDRLRFAWGLPLAMFLASTLWNVAAIRAGAAGDDWAVWFNPLAKAHMFAAGMALAVTRVVLRSRLPLSRPRVWALRACAITALVVTAGTDHETTLQVWVHHDVTTLAYTALLASSVLAPDGGSWRRALARPELVWLGAVSYSIYLWHEPVLHWLDDHGLVSHLESAVPVVTMTLLATALPVAALSHYVLERPFSRLRAAFDAHGRRHDYYADAAAVPVLAPGAEEEGWAVVEQAPGYRVDGEGHYFVDSRPVVVASPDAFGEDLGDLGDYVAAETSRHSRAASGDAGDDDRGGPGTGLDAPDDDLDGPGTDLDGPDDDEVEPREDERSRGVAAALAGRHLSPQEARRARGAHRGRPAPRHGVRRADDQGENAAQAAPMTRAEARRLRR